MMCEFVVGVNVTIKRFVGGFFKIAYWFSNSGILLRESSREECRQWQVAFRPDRTT